MKRTFYQLVRFATVGSANTVLDAAVYIALTRISPFFMEHYLFASTIAFGIAGLNSFMWNKHWTFKDKAKYTHAQLTRFFIILAITYGLNQLFLWQLVQWGVFDVTAKVAAAVTAGVLNFTMQKLWAFPVVDLSKK